MTQCEKRAQPMHEIQANIASKNIQKSLQNIGLLHDVSNNSCSIQVNGNSSRIVHCKFCSLRHIVTNCPRCNELKPRTYDYQLSTNSEQDMDHLRQRARNTHIPQMGVVLHQCQIFDFIPAYLQSKNFIIHHVQDIGTTSFAVIKNSVCCVTFLSANGWEVPIWNKKWIMGKVLNQVITHKNKTKKYVYDETALQSSLSDWTLAEDKFQVATSMI